MSTHGEENHDASVIRSYFHPDGQVIQPESGVRLIQIHLQRHRVLTYFGQIGVVVTAGTEVDAIVAASLLLGQLQVKGRSQNRVTTLSAAS